jgi:hypothetical protein
MQVLFGRRAKGALLLFLLSLPVGRIFFSFFPVSQCVLTREFLMGSLFPKFTMFHTSSNK